MTTPQTQTPWTADEKRGAVIGFLILGAILVLGAIGNSMGSGSGSSSSSHCASAAEARYKYVPGGATSAMKSDFASRCESSDRDVVNGIYGSGK